MTSPQVIEQVKAKLAAMHAEEAREAEALRVTRYVVFAMFAILLAVAAGLLLRPRANGGGAGCGHGGEWVRSVLDRRNQGVHIGIQDSGLPVAVDTECRGLYWRNHPRMLQLLLVS